MAVGIATFERYESIVKRHLIPHLGGIKLRDLSPADIQRYYRKELEGGRLNPDGTSAEQGLSPTTVRQHHIVLGRALKQAVRWGLLKRYIMDGVTPPKKEKTDVTVWNAEETTRFLQVAAHTRNYALYTTALGTGLRRGEVLALQWKDIDFDNNILTIRRSLVKVGAPPTFKGPKTRSGWRVVSISPGLARILRRHRANQNREKLALGSEYDDYDLVFAQATGRSLRANNFVRREYRYLIEKAGVRYIKFHDLRHTHATNLLRRGVPAKIVADRLGHSSITVTMDIYSHVLPEMQSDAAAAIDDVLPDAEEGK